MAYSYVHETAENPSCLAVADASILLDSCGPASESGNRSEAGVVPSDVESADSVPLYQVSRDFTAEVTLYDSSEQSYTVTVKLSVTMSLHLLLNGNETVWSNVCYYGSWDYSTSVTISNWGPKCPWDDAEKARQKKKVEDSIYIQSLNIECINVLGTQNVCHYWTNDRFFGVEFEAGVNTLEGTITVASSYLPKYTVKVEDRQNSGTIGQLVPNATGGYRLVLNADLNSDKPKPKITSVSINTSSIPPNEYSFISCSASITVDVPKGEASYSVVFTLSIDGKTESIEESITLVGSTDGNDFEGARTPTSYMDQKEFVLSQKLNYTFCDYDPASKKIVINVSTYSDTTHSTFLSKQYQPGSSQDYTLTVTFGEATADVTKTITVSNSSKEMESCWANNFLYAFGLDINTNNLSRLFCNASVAGKGGEGPQPYGTITKALEKAGFNPEPTHVLSKETVYSVFQTSKIFLEYGGKSETEAGHGIYVYNISEEEGRYFVDCYDTNNSPREHKYEMKDDPDNSGCILLYELSSNNEPKNDSAPTKYTGMWSIPKSSKLKQDDFEERFPLKTELTIGVMGKANESKRSATRGLLTLSASRSPSSYVYTFTDAEYSDVYVTSLNVAFGQNATLRNAWLREGSTVGIMDGAAVSECWVQDDSTLFLYSGATISGTLTVSGKLVVEGPLTLNDAEIELDISSLDGTGNNASLIDGIDYLNGASWSIAVSSDQNAGTYLLADNVSSFDGGVVIDYRDSIGVGETLAVGPTNYTLNLSSGGELTLSIAYDEPEDGIAPTTPVITGVTTDSGTVTLNWNASTDLNGISQYVLSYSLNESFWQSAYICTTDTSASISGLQDGLYYMRVCAYDTYGNISDYSETQRVQVGPPELAVSTSESGIFLNRYKNEGLTYIFSSEIRNDSDLDIDDLYVKIMISTDRFYSKDDYMLTGMPLGALKAGETTTALCKFNIPERYLNGDYYIGIVASDYTENYQYEVADWIAFNGTDELEYYGTDVLLPYEVPEAEYMYGCTPTAIGMLLGYYDLYGYRGMDLSNLIEGDVDLKSRGTDGSAYNMNAFDTALGRAIASEEYVYRFVIRDGVETTPEQEYFYSYGYNGDGITLDRSEWNCLADYIGTGQFWRGSDNLSTSISYGMLEDLCRNERYSTLNREGYTWSILYRDTRMLYGLDQYVKSRGYSLDYEITGTHAVDVDGGDFTFEDYMREIDAGRPVEISITEHSMVGYGYNEATKEIIFDDGYTHDQRMVWGETYFYAEEERALESITVIGFSMGGSVDLAIAVPEDDGSGLILSASADAAESSDYFFSDAPVFLTYTVSNLGEDASGAFQAPVLLDGETLSTSRIDSLAGGTSRTVAMSLGELPVGLHNVRVVLDEPNEIQEQFGYNNTAEESIFVLKPGTSIVSYYEQVYEDETLRDTYVHKGGVLFLDGGQAFDTVLRGEVTSRSSDGTVWYRPVHAVVAEGGCLSGTDAYDYGTVVVSSGGVAESTRVFQDARLVVSSGGVASDVEIGSYGTLTLEDGGRLTGTLRFSEDAFVEVSGGVLHFDLSDAAPGAAPLVNDLSVIQGTPVYTLTLPSSPSTGAYRLAAGATGFSGTISIANAAGDSIGSLAVRETISVGDAEYSLNLAESTLTLAVKVSSVVPDNLVGMQEKASWESAGTGQYIVEYSTDNFEHVIQVVTTGNAVDTPDLPAGTYQWRVRGDGDNGGWAVGEAIVSAEPENNAPKVVQSNEDGNDDLFFASPVGTWGGIYYAQHVGSVNDGWGGTNELVSASGKGRIQNLYFGSADPNVLCLTDGENGDAIFVDDVFTELPESIAEQTARLYQIREIRAGAGDDIVDMTSQRFEYTGDGLTIRGGDGSDVIWANKGDNFLFGDAGNDRIVGASGNDVIAGGIGSDSMHGGGGDDIFTFCENWGADTVEQLATGTVTLWFASGDESNWNAETLTYADGENSVRVSGVTADRIELKFGGNGEEEILFAALSGIGAFDAFASQRIFEESGAGILAGQ